MAQVDGYAPAAASQSNVSGLGGTFGGATGSSAVSFGATGGLAANGTMPKPQRRHEGFRSQNVRYLQEQNREATKELEHAETERDEAFAEVTKWEQRWQQAGLEKQKLEQQLADTEEKCNISAAEVHKKDEMINWLGERNQTLLQSLEEEESGNRVRNAQVQELTDTQNKLQNISDQYDNIKETGNSQLNSAYTQIAKCEEELRNAESETEQLLEAELNCSAQAKIDQETLEAKLKESKDRNVEYLQQIQHNEVFEHRLTENLQRLREKLEELTVQKKGMKMQMDYDGDRRDKWLQSKAEVERRKVAIEASVEHLRAALRDAEAQNKRMQEENKQGADTFRQLSDKVYSLMAQLRQHQMDLKKQEQNGADKQKQIATLDKQGQTLQANLQVEVDAKLAAESEARNAAQNQALLQKKNKMLEDALQMALKAQEKVEKRLQELHEKANALRTQNDYLETRIDGNEEDKGGLRYELRRAEEALRQATATNGQLVVQKSDSDDRLNGLEAEKASLKADLDYIKREDMLDESGRTKPILIESESKLIERLQINEFLYSAQQERNPIPMLIEKISHILEMLHTAQTQADHYLQDLEKSNSMLTALRQKNMTLYEKVGLCETWKMRALLKIASNAFETRETIKGHNRAPTNANSHSLYLDGLQYTTKELQELKKVISNYSKQDAVKEIHLQDNQLDKSALSIITELVNLCPYLTRLDLQRNRLDDNDINDLSNALERLPGVTIVTKDPANGDLVAKAGNQVRLVVQLEDQTPPEPNTLGPGVGDTFDDLFGDDPAGPAADKFLASGAGLTGQTRLQGPDSKTNVDTRTLLPPQRGGVAYKEDKRTVLPRISSAGQLTPKARRG